MKHLCKCGKLATEKVCPTCRQKGVDVSKMYGKQAWRILAKRRLAENPLCEECMSRPSVQAHHRIKALERPDLFFYYENTMALCRECHWEKEKGK